MFALAVRVCTLPTVCGKVRGAAGETRLREREDVTARRCCYAYIYRRRGSVMPDEWRKCCALRQIARLRYAARAAAEVRSAISNTRCAENYAVHVMRRPRQRRAARNARRVCYAARDAAQYAACARHRAKCDSECSREADARAFAAYGASASLPATAMAGAQARARARARLCGAARVPQRRQDAAYARQRYAARDVVTSAGYYEPQPVPSNP